MDLDDILNPVEDRTEDYAFFVGLKVAAETLGLSEGQFAAPLDQVVQALAAMVSHEFRLSQEYTFYAEMLRGLDRGALASLFTELSYDERRDAEYFLRRISALMPGGVQIPPVPTPQPLPDGLAILDAMIASEQQGILMLRQLRDLAGDNPLRFEVEQRLADEQKHLDRLWQHKPVVQPKVAFAQESLRLKWANLGLQEQSMAFEQAKNENAFLQDQLAQTREQLLAATEQSEQAGAQAAEAQAQVQQAVMQADMAQQDALAAQTAAAEHANVKLRLAQRIQQTRQTLADLAAQDPVAEEGVGVDPTMTTTQADQAAQQMMQDPAAQQDPTQQAAPQPAQSGAPAGQGATNITVKAAGVRDMATRALNAAAMPGVAAAITVPETLSWAARAHPKLAPLETAAGYINEHLDQLNPNQARALGLAGTAGMVATPTAAAYALGKHQGRKDVTTAQQDLTHNTVKAAKEDVHPYLKGVWSSGADLTGLTDAHTQGYSVPHAFLGNANEYRVNPDTGRVEHRAGGVVTDLGKGGFALTKHKRMVNRAMLIYNHHAKAINDYIQAHPADKHPDLWTPVRLGGGEGKTAASPLSQAAANLAKKVRPTQAIPAVTPMAAAKHMAAHNPALAIQAGRQGAPVVASPSVLEELSRTSFGKLSTGGTPQNPTVGQR